MTKKSFIESERKRIEKMRKLQLPHRFKKIGLVLSIVSFIGILIMKLTSNIPELKFILIYGMIIGLLLYSISKDQIEDEFIINLRLQSYTFAFIVTVLSVLIQPLMNVIVDIIKNNDIHFEGFDNSNGRLILLMLIMQVSYFIILKKLYK